MADEAEDGRTLHRSNNRKRWVVIFVGPHKTGSTSLEQFFQTHAHATTTTSQTSQASAQATFPHAFDNWTWPLIGTRTDGNALFDYEPKLRKRNSTLFLKFEQTIRRSIQQTGGNLIFGTENLDRFEATGALDKLLSFVQDGPEASIEFLVHYRSPRVDHVISWWKQQTRKGRLQQGQSFRHFWCQAPTGVHQHPFPLYLDPLYLVQRLMQRVPSTRRIWILDMGGVKHNHLDISHTVACEVLGVPCEGGWIQEQEQDELLSSTSTNITANTKQVEMKNVLPDQGPNLPSNQLDRIEEILQRHDCLWQAALKYHPNVTILQSTTIWNDCSVQQNHALFPSPEGVQQEWENTTEAIRTIIDCDGWSAQREKDDDTQAEDWSGNSGRRVVTISIIMIAILYVLLMPLLRRKRCNRNAHTGTS